MRTYHKSCREAASRRSTTVPTPLLLFSLMLLVFSCLTARAQDADSTDRVYKHRKVEVEEALQSLKAYATNRLPVLDGFVNANATTIAKLENPHYQLRIEVESQGPNQTLVSVIAKITAWSAEQDPSRSQYVVIPSNGRLEQDMLDRLSVLLEKGNVDRNGGSSGAPNSDRSAASAADSASASASPTPGVAAGGSTPGSPHSPAPDASPVGPTASSPGSRSNPADPSVIASEIASIRAQRQATEMHKRKLTH